MFNIAWLLQIKIVVPETLFHFAFSLTLGTSMKEKVTDLIIVTLHLTFHFGKLWELNVDFPDFSGHSFIRKWIMLSKPVGKKEKVRGSKKSKSYHLIYLPYFRNRVRYPVETENAFPFYSWL